MSIVSASFNFATASWGDRGEDILFDVSNNQVDRQYKYTTTVVRLFCAHAHESCHVRILYNTIVPYRNTNVYNYFILDYCHR